MRRGPAGPRLSHSSGSPGSPWFSGRFWFFRSVGSGCAGSELFIPMLRLHLLCRPRKGPHRAPTPSHPHQGRGGHLFRAHPTRARVEARMAPRHWRRCMKSSLRCRRAFAAPSRDTSRCGCESRSTREVRCPRRWPIAPARAGISSDKPSRPPKSGRSLRSTLRPNAPCRSGLTSAATGPPGTPSHYIRSATAKAVSGRVRLRRSPLPPASVRSRRARYPQRQCIPVASG